MSDTTRMNDNLAVDLPATNDAEDESDELFSGNDSVSQNYGSNGILFIFTCTNF